MPRGERDYELIDRERISVFHRTDCRKQVGEARALWGTGWREEGFLNTDCAEYRVTDARGCGI